MSKYTISSKVRHSRYGEGAIKSVRVETRTPPSYDPIALRREELNLQARLAEIANIRARGTAPYNVDVYTVEFEGGRELDFEELGVDKLRERYTMYDNLDAQRAGGV